MTDHPRWVADPRIGWRILLTAELVAPAETAAVAGRLADLYARQEWGTAPALLVDEDIDRLRARLVTEHPDPVLAGLAGQQLVVSAHHSRVDGLGLLQVLGALCDAPVRSSARGVGERATTGSALRTSLGRLAEVVARPPARVTTTGRPLLGVAGDTLVERELPGRWRTADLVDATAQGVRAHQVARGQQVRRVAIAVGAIREPAADDLRIADRSVLLRLRDVERLDRARIADLLRTAPVHTPPQISAGGGPVASVLDRATATGLRVLAPRLGSTVLVSHLGEVTAPGVARLAFDPVTAGGSGISLGAVGLSGRTVVALRARGDRWDADGLERLLEAIVDRL